MQVIRRYDGRCSLTSVTLQSCGAVGSPAGYAPPFARKSPEVFHILLTLQLKDISLHTKVPVLFLGPRLVIDIYQCFYSRLLHRPAALSTLWTLKKHVPGNIYGLRAATPWPVYSQTPLVSTITTPPAWPEALAPYWQYPPSTQVPRLEDISRMEQALWTYCSREHARTTCYNFVDV